MQEVYDKFDDVQMSLRNIRNGDKGTMYNQLAIDLSHQHTPALMETVKVLMAKAEQWSRSEDNVLAALGSEMLEEVSAIMGHQENEESKA